MGNALSMAAEIFASAQGGVSSPQPEQTEPQQASAAEGGAMSRDEIASMLASMLASRSQGEKPEGAAEGAANVSTPEAPPQSGSSAAPGPGPGPGLGNIAAVLPPIMQAISGNGSFIKPEKLNLIKALKPYMTEARGSSIDRAIRMANIAQAAKTALTALGR